MGTFRALNRSARQQAWRTLVPADDGAVAHGDFPHQYLPDLRRIAVQRIGLRRATHWAIKVAWWIIGAYALAIVFCALTFGGSGPVIIGHSYADHHGGVVEAFAAKYAAIRAAGQKVVIDGPCVSACTIVASLPRDQVCITPRAMLGVHLAADGDDHIDRAYTAWAVNEYYPPALRNWIARHGGLSDAPKWVRYRDLLAIFPACGDRMTDDGRPRTDR
jgi:hypothetical protein